MHIIAIRKSDSSAESIRITACSINSFGPNIQILSDKINTSNIFLDLISYFNNLIFIYIFYAPLDVEKLKRLYDKFEPIFLKLN